MEQRHSHIFLLVSFLASLLTLLIINPVFAAVQIQPVETVEATPITSFSEETNQWPAQSMDDEILQAKSTSLFESLAWLPGVDTRGSLSKGSPAISLRGSTRANRVLVLYDGIPLNLADGLGAQELLLPREAISSVHFLRGPSSVYFGASAMSGALNLLPDIYTRSRIRLTGGSFGQKGVFGAASLINNDRNQLQITTFNESIDGNYAYFSPVNGQKGTRTRSNTHTQRTTATGNHIVEGFRIGYRFLHAEEYGSSPGPITLIDPLSYRKKADLYAVRVFRELDRHWSTNFQSSYVATQSHFLTESTQSSYAARASLFAGQLGFNYLRSDELQWRFFVDAKENLLTSSATQNQKKKSTELEPGLFLQFPFAEDIVLQSGLRYVADHGVVTKALGVIQQKGATKYWLTYSEGFRTPSLSDKFDSFGTFSGNPNLSPEESEQLEAGVSHEGVKTSNYLLNKINIEASVFSVTYDNLITSSADGTTLVNTDAAQAFGAEGSLNIPFELWGVGLGYAYLEANAKKTPLPFTTQQKVNATLSHYFGPLIFDFSTTAWINYRRSSAPKDQVSWLVSNFLIRTIGLSDWAVNTGVYNLFEQPVEYASGYPEPRRRFFVSVERLF